MKLETAFHLGRLYVKGGNNRKLVYRLRCLLKFLSLTITNGKNNIYYYVCLPVFLCQCKNMPDKEPY